MAIKLRHWRDMEGVVRDHQVYTGFGEIGHLTDAPGLCVEPVGRHQLVFFCRAVHPLLAQETMSVADLDGYPFAGVPVPPGMAQMFPRNCCRPDIDRAYRGPGTLAMVDAARCRLCKIPTSSMSARGLRCGAGTATARGLGRLRRTRPNRPWFRIRTASAEESEPCASANIFFNIVQCRTMFAVHGL